MARSQTPRRAADGRATIEVRGETVAHGGDTVARHDGKVIFVDGLLPDEVGRVVVHDDRGRFARARAVEVLDPHPARVEPPCPAFGACGGCRWQHVAHEVQVRWRAGIVADQLTRIGRFDPSVVADPVDLGRPYGYRNRLRFEVAAGRPAQFRRRSHDPVPLDDCLLLIDPLRDVLRRLPPLHGIDRLVLRGGERTGDRLLVAWGTVPEAVVDLAAAEGIGLALSRRGGLKPLVGDPWVEEIVAGVRFRITGAGFFQVNTTGADALVALVARMLDVHEDEVLLDGYAGVGLFAGTVGRRARSVIAVEQNPKAEDDLRRNLGAADVRHRIVIGPVEDTLPTLGEGWDVAVVDPAREGMGRRGVDAVTAPMPRAIAYVSCDPASFARDARLLADRGYKLLEVVPVDLFPQTPHVELVGSFARDEAAFRDW